MMFLFRNRDFVYVHKVAKNKMNGYDYISKFNKPKHKEGLQWVDQQKK